VRLVILKAVFSTTRRVVGRVIFYFLQEVCVTVSVGGPSCLVTVPLAGVAVISCSPRPQGVLLGLRVLLQWLLGLKAFAVAHVRVFCLFAFGFLVSPGCVLSPSPRAGQVARRFLFPGPSLYSAGHLSMITAAEIGCASWVQVG